MKKYHGIFFSQIKKLQVIENLGERIMTQEILACIGKTIHF